MTGADGAQQVADAAVSHISIQLYSVREALAADLPATLARVRSLGFEAVELVRTLEWQDEFARHLPDAGLTASSAHARLVAGSDEAYDPAPVLDAAARVGAPIVIDPRIDRTKWATLQDVLASADALNRAAHRAAEWGLTVGYHNHDVELLHRIGDRTALEVFADALDERVALEVDVYWAAIAGVDPVALLDGVGARARLLHLKDAPTLGDGAIDRDIAHQVPFGHGALDAAAILAAAPHGVVPVVEFDHYEGDVFVAAAAARTWLSERIGRRR